VFSSLARGLREARRLPGRRSTGGPGDRHRRGDRQPDPAPDALLETDEISLRATQRIEALASVLRTTRLRAVDGTVWHVPNGEIRRVGNMSQHWSRAVLDIDVAYDTELDHAGAVIKRAFDAENIEIPFPQQTVWMRPDPAVAS
jgi:small-conductance mechanosensitive channel